MGSMLVERFLEALEQILGLGGRKPAFAKTADQMLLLNDMPFALGNMPVDHLDVGHGIGHGPA
jgi:hypothetical protein